MDQLLAVSKEALEEMVQEMLDARVQEQVEKILQERGLGIRPGARGTRPWSRVRAEIEARLKLAPGRESERYQALAAVALIVRRALGLSHVRFIAPEREGEALEVAHAVLDLMKVPRAGVGDTGADPGGAESGA